MFRKLILSRLETVSIDFIILYLSINIKDRNEVNWKHKTHILEAMANTQFDSE